MNVRLTREAEDDLAEAYAWYWRRGLGLGAAFLRSVESRLESIGRLPEGYPVVYRHVRRALLRRYPYALFYEVAGDEAVVIGCFHAARDPRHWQERVRA